MATKNSAALKKPASVATTAVTVRKPTSGAVVDIQARLREQAAGMSERTAPPGGNKIQVTQDKTFKLPNGQIVTELRGVIVDFVTTHHFYENKYDKKNIVPPGCFAVGSNPKNMAPVAESPNRQADNCQECPMNQFGSDGEGKACKNGRLLALLPPNDAGDDVDAEADMWTLGVSPTALKGFDGFVQQLARTFQQPPVGFLVTIGFDPSVEHAKLVFSDPAPIASVAAAFARQDEAKDMLNVKPDFSGWVDPNASKRAAKPAAKAGARR